MQQIHSFDVGIGGICPVFAWRISQTLCPSPNETVELRIAAIIAFIYFFGYIGLALAPETKGKPLPK